MLHIHMRKVYEKDKERGQTNETDRLTWTYDIIPNYSNRIETMPVLI
jgi:hypothetical protein